MSEDVDVSPKIPPPAYGRLCGRSCMAPNKVRKGHKNAKCGESCAARSVWEPILSIPEPFRGVGEGMLTAPLNVDRRVAASHA